jgi:hypothetical protein
LQFWFVPSPQQVCPDAPHFTQESAVFDETQARPCPHVRNCDPQHVFPSVPQTRHAPLLQRFDEGFISQLPPLATHTSFEQHPMSRQPKSGQQLLPQPPHAMHFPLLQMVKGALHRAFGQQSCDSSPHVGPTRPSLPPPSDSPGPTSLIDAASVAGAASVPMPPPAPDPRPPVAPVSTLETSALPVEASTGDPPPRPPAAADDPATPGESSNSGPYDDEVQARHVSANHAPRTTFVAPNRAPKQLPMGHALP